ncbi:hypothetical protein M1770_04390 [Spiroplasma citri]|uniref:hypothetical protein n=1 Tax=Spiroplasma citri TaxID=2133 RepID=UPI0024128893|nr:hypothetical protein [Spiroplasma citri]WFG99198.1 hypothetical protein M1770_04390 [Spiroplasma citri]
MLKLIRLLTAALQDTKIGELLKDGLKKYGIIKKETSQFKKLYNWTDPRNILQYLKKATKQEINSLLDKIEKRSLEQGKNLFNEQYQDSKEWVNIQSSWIKYGKFEMTNKITNTGNATFLFQPKVKVYGHYNYDNKGSEWLNEKRCLCNTWWACNKCKKTLYGSLWAS